jgi:hypothetical protein
MTAENRRKWNETPENEAGEAVNASPCDSFRRSAKTFSGGGGIRTHGRLSPTPVFETVSNSNVNPCRKRCLGTINNHESLHCPYEGQELPSDLIQVIKVWHTLPEVIRLGIVAMIRASGA